MNYNIEPQRKLVWNQINELKKEQFPIFFVRSPWEDYVTMAKITCLHPTFSQWEISLLNGIKVMKVPGTPADNDKIRRIAEQEYCKLLTDLVNWITTPGSHAGKAKAYWDGPEGQARKNRWAEKKAKMEQAKLEQDKKETSN